ncbi:Uncharacterized protein Rs2_33092 [Raphanus sativus]|uniref:Uncharacterized protein LOC108818288 isoform X2 n=1 Tax=Raphanus sativus TaxID=3726 RepID=A0A6J0KI20_RAPSA|nr:uncharacterized protein LOC108818288 isoform X2 [Raphanus sativus]KAJ4882999.1 Uncharacterized protein Rs2_33092 [Raphanus sativus]
MADKPSRALVLYGDGLARSVDPSNTHIYSLASVGTCGFLSLPHAPPETENERVVREFSHLLDASEAYTIANGLKTKGSENDISTLSERFMGLKAALVTDTSSLTSFGKLIGLDVLQLSEISQKSDDDSFPSDATATELLRLLGFEGGKCLDVSLYDSVFVHIGGGDDNGGMIDSLIGSVMRMAQPGSEIVPRLHLSLVLSYGSVTDKDVSVFSVKAPREGVNPAFQGLVPRQSYTMRGEKPRDDVRDYCPMLVAQWQDAVTRKDLVDTLSFEALKKLSGNLVIPADRFIHEVAFKLWKAPKYGA